MPFADDYDTVGELYEGIAASFAALEEQHAGAAIPLFIGPKSAQLSERDFRLQGLQPVASAAEVRHVVDLIVHQGEGSMEATAESHYARFRAIREEWRALHEARKEFVPSSCRGPRPCDAAAGRAQSTRARDRKSGRTAAGPRQCGVRIDVATDDFHAR